MDDASKGTKMIHAGLGVHVDRYGPLPLWVHTIDGNQNGRTAIQEHLALFAQHLPTLKLAQISDRGTYSFGHLVRLEDAGCEVIVSAPWSEFRELFDEHRQTLQWQRASYLSIEQQRRRECVSDLPQESYDLAVLKHTLTSHESDRQIPCRVLFVKSTADEQYDGFNAIVTTIPANKSSADDIFTRFKQQIYSEQINAHFKGPIAVRPVWLKSPKRIESLMFLLTIALMLHYLIQRTYRASLPETASVKERRITTQTLLNAFQNYTLLIDRHGLGRTVSPTRLTSRQSQILRQLELPTPAETLRRLLPRPPE